MPEKDTAQKTQERWFQKLRNWFRADPPLYIRYFVPILIFLGLAGGIAALLVPVNIGWLHQNGLSGEAEQKSISDLRLHFLYITGGIIAVLTLLQTNWKNKVDRRKVEDDIQKNKNDHIRQVHAERRKRYTTAVEQLANEKAAVRLGGVYTLIGLVDEWLDDNKSLADNNRSSDKSKKEGQIIVNSLCAYIKSPLETENKTITSHITGQEERGIRQAILHEIHTRLHSKNSSSEPEEYKPGPWSKFSFDFSNSEFFYPVDFSNGFFEEETNFTESTFTENANFKNARFKESAIFNSTKFISTHAKNYVSFEKAEVSGVADFSSSLFTIPLNCESAVFNDEIRITKSHFIQTTLYSENIHYHSEPILEKVAGTGYMALSSERRLIPHHENFIMASFAGATFNNGFTMQGAHSEGVINFVSESKEATKFSYKLDPLKYNFDLHRESFQIDTNKIISPDGKPFEIPVGTVLFDPSSGETSDPAKPLDKSNDGEEDKSK